MRIRGTYRTAVCVAIMLATASPPLAQGQVNSWTNKSGGKWESGGNWSLGIPPALSHSAVISNGVVIPDLDKSILIDGTTSGSFPATMTVTNVTVSGLGLFRNHLELKDAGLATPLAIQNALTLKGRSFLLISNSVLQVFGRGGGIFSDDGSVVLQSGMISNRYVACGTFCFTYGPSTVIGNTGTGTFTVADGIWISGPVQVGSSLSTSGTLTIADGTNSLASTFNTFGTYGTLGVVNGGVVMTGGRLDVSGTTQIGAGGGVGQMMVSGGVWSADEAVVGQAGSRGTLTIAGGTNSITTCSVGGFGIGNMLVSGGSVTSIYLYVGRFSGGNGSLDISGGRYDVLYQYMVGAECAGDVLMTGGQLIVSHGPTYLGFITNGSMTVSNGLFAALDVHVGDDAALFGTGDGVLTIAGGACSASSNMILGNLSCTTTGSVTVAGGSLDITNTVTNAVLDIRNGTFTLSAGTVTVDRIVMTNTCGQFAHTGGTLVYKQLIVSPAGDADGDGLPNGWEQLYGLDPLDASGENGAGGDPDGDGQPNLQEEMAGTKPNDPASVFRATELAREGSNLRITWTTVTGKTYRVLAAPGSAGGGYQGGLTNLGALVTANSPGESTTNLVDSGAATNAGGRYYTIRLVP